MKFGFIAKHRAIWPIKWLCEALGVSLSGFHAWLTRSPSRRAREDEALSSKVRASFLDSDIIRALRNGASDSINQTGQQIVQRQLNIAPTLTIRPGFPVRVIVTRDLVLEPYGG